MKIECLAENYTCFKKENQIFVINNIYQSSLLYIFISAIIEVMLPDINNFNVPLGIEINDNTSEIKIDKNLNVIGTTKFRYFIPKDHYLKWKKTYKVSYWLIILFGIIASMLLLYIYLIPSELNVLAGLAFFVVFTMLTFTGYKYRKQTKIIKQYQIINFRI